MQNNFDLDKIAQLARVNEYTGIPDNADLYTTAKKDIICLFSDSLHMCSVELSTHVLC
jgi:hypothetical protein